MNPSSERKQRTHERILVSAGRVFRRKGYAGAGVDAVMGEAGLTHGGFYAHFDGKEALFAETVTRALGRTVEIMEKEAGDREGVAWLRVAVRRYLSRPHLEAVEEGCPMPALVSELGRAGDAPGPGLEPDDRALATVALCVGGISMARAVKDPALADRILAACRKLAVPEDVPDGSGEGRMTGRGRPG